MIHTKEKYLYKFDIRCPCCKRKLMILNLSNYNKSQVSVLGGVENWGYITQKHDALYASICGS